MSRTHYVDFRGTGLWAYDVASSVFLKFLIDAADVRTAADSDHWLDESIQHWRVGAVVTDYGLHLDDDWSQSQTDTVIVLCRAAAAAILKRGDMPAAEIESWPMLDGRCIFTRGHDPMPAAPVARFGDAVATLLEDKLPKPPDRHCWFYTLDDNVQTIPMRADA